MTQWTLQQPDAVLLRTYPPRRTWIWCVSGVLSCINSICHFTCSWDIACLTSLRGVCGEVSDYMQDSADKSCQQTLWFTQVIDNLYIICPLTFVLPFLFFFFSFFSRFPFSFHFLIFSNFLYYFLPSPPNNIITSSRNWIILSPQCARARNDSGEHVTRLKTVFSHHHTSKSHWWFYHNTCGLSWW